MHEFQYFSILLPSMAVSRGYFYIQDPLLFYSFGNEPS